MLVECLVGDGLVMSSCREMAMLANEEGVPDELLSELPPAFAAVRSLAVGISRVPDVARFAYNKEMTRQDLVNVYRAGLADRDVEGLVARIVTPEFKGVRRDLKKSLFVLRAARTAVAIRRYGRANGGEVPSDLSALVPACLAEVPRDPFAPDRALGYDAPTRQLWTVGADGDFNALDSAQTVKYGFKRKRAKCVFLLDGKRIE